MAPRAAKAPIIVRFGGMRIIRSLLTSAVSPVYWMVQPRRFRPSGFLHPAGRRDRSREGPGLRGWVQPLLRGPQGATSGEWLDLVALSHLLHPDDDIHSVRYFTARVKGDQDPTAPGRQKLYLTALSTLPAVSVHFGQFRTHPVAMPLANPAPGKGRTVRVLKTEEKGSDVNLAASMTVVRQPPAKTSTVAA